MIAGCYEVIVVGTGRAGSYIARTLYQSGVSVALISRSEKCPLDGSIPVYAQNDPQCPRCCHFVLLAVPDNRIQAVAQTMREVGVIGPDSLVGHVSGALSSSVLSPPVAPERRFSAHPLLAFPSPDFGSSGEFLGLKDITVAVEAPQRSTLKAVAKLFERTKAKVVTLEPANKPLYHAAAVLVSAFPFMYLCISTSIFRACGLPDPEEDAARLMSSALARFMETKSFLGLTGPFARGESETVVLNLQALQSYAIDVEKVYRAQGLLLAKLLFESGKMGKETYAEFRKVLEQEVPV